MSKTDFLETITLWESIMHEAFGYTVFELQQAEVDAYTLAGPNPTEQEYFNALRRLVMSGLIGRGL